MSNRKLTGALTILLLAALFMAIGCGDGKRNSRVPVKKINAGGRVGSNPEKLKQIEGMKTQINQLESGRELNSQSIPNGTYKLDEITAHVSFFNAGDEVAALAAGRVSENGSLVSVTANQTGLVAKDSDVQRLLEVPTSLVAQGGTLQASASAIYSCTVAGDGKIEHSLNPLNGSGVTVDNLLQKIGGAVNVSFSGNKSGEIHIREIQGGIRISVTVFEKEMAQKGSGTKNSHLIKKMIFSYKLQANGNPVPAPGLSTGNPNPGSGLTN